MPTIEEIQAANQQELRQAQERIQDLEDDLAASESMVQELEDENAILKGAIKDAHSILKEQLE